MLATTRFTDPAAVEAWDSWFRWRDHGGLRDLTIDTTWWRVAQTLAAVDGPCSALLAHQFVNAFSRWALLPDERLLRCAGTDIPLDDLDSPAAVLNIAAFVSSSTGQAVFDRDGFIATAELAVHLLDNAVTLFPSRQQPASLAVGVIGLSDALQELDCPLSSALARGYAREIAKSLAEGCLRGSVRLAGERGSLLPPAQRLRLAELWRARGMPESLINEALELGVRHAALTAVRPHPQLAALANNVADVAVPLHTSGCPAPFSVNEPVQNRTLQGELLAAMQPWIDAPIRQWSAATSDALRVTAGS